MRRLQTMFLAPTYGVVATAFPHQIGPAQQVMWILFGAVGVLLPIAYASVSGLMLTGAALRHQPMLCGWRLGQAHRPPAGNRPSRRSS